MLGLFTRKVETPWEIIRAKLDLFFDLREKINENPVRS